MSDTVTRGAGFGLFHPAVALLYFAGMLVLGMSALQPVYLLMTLIAALALNALLGGIGATLRGLCLIVPLVVLVALVNPLFARLGTTELLHIGGLVLHLESMAYGACMGVMLASTLLVFANAAHVLSSDKIMALFGGALPTVSLMLSMTARLIPQLLRRGRQVHAVRTACTAAHGADGRLPSGRRGKARGRIAARAAEFSVLAGWAMEDSLITAESMRARRWGAAPERASYRRLRFGRADALACILVAAVLAASAASAWTAAARFSFYPVLAGIAPWWSYLPYAIYLAAPFALEIRERLLWKGLPR